MDGAGGARDPRFASGYGMGLLGSDGPPELYGLARGPGPARAPQQARGLKRPGDCYDERGAGPPGLGLEHCALPDISDDGYTSLQPKKSPPSNGKKTKGRVKIKMEYIDNKLRRYTTFSKRKTGIMKKAYELSTLTGTQVMLLVASETGHVYTFATRKLQPMITSESGKRLIQTCLNSPDPPSGAPVGDQRMSATGFEETELTYNIADDDIKVRQLVYSGSPVPHPSQQYVPHLDHPGLSGMSPPLQQYHQHPPCPSPLLSQAYPPHSHAHIHPHMSHHPQR